MWFPITIIASDITPLRATRKVRHPRSPFLAYIDQYAEINKGGTLQVGGGWRGGQIFAFPLPLSCRGEGEE